MEENKKEQKKLSYEELSKAAGELHMQYQKLMAEYKNAVAALEQRDFEATAFSLQMLFKVMEHPEMYTEDFVKWSSATIESSLRASEDAASVGQVNEEEENGEAE